MISGIDSATPPTAAQADAARAAGVSLWSGYLATRSGVRLANPWAQRDFEAARRCGGTPIAYCSGWDDPGACRALAQQWNVRLCLDVESSIRDDGPWVNPWLQVSGAGLYGGYYIHTNHRQFIYFRVMAGYPGYDPGLVWPADQTHWFAGSYGWQWQGSHIEFGVGVDRGWYDSWFGPPLSPPQPPIQEIDVQNLVIVNSPAGEWLWNTASGQYVHLDDPNGVGQLEAAGVKAFSAGQSFHDALLAASNK